MSVEFPVLSSSYNKQIDALFEDIKKEATTAMESFLKIGFNLIELKELHGKYEKHFYKRVADELGIKKTRANNLMNVALKFGEKEKLAIKPEYADYNYSTLVEVLPLPEETIQKEIKPTDSKKTAREKKKQIQKKNVQPAEQIELEIETKTIEEVHKLPDIVEFYKTKHETTKSGTTYYKQVKLDWDKFCDSKKEEGFKKIELLNAALIEYMKKYEEK